MGTSLISFNFIEKARINVYEEFPKNFELKRVFTVYGGNKEVRGGHAHKKCTQILICVRGKIDVNIKGKDKIVLSDPSVGLKIPPLIWSSQTYQKDETILMVLCDKKYDENDYIRSYSDYLEIIKGSWDDFI